MKMLSYILTAQTSLHVGDLGNGIGVVDKMVQRDTVTGLPCIHGSGLKGALREQMKAPPETQDFTTIIFGGEGDDMSSGRCIFPEARLLAIPARSSAKPYRLATTLDALADCEELLFGDAKQAFSALRTAIQAQVSPLQGQAQDDRRSVVFSSQPITVVATERLESTTPVAAKQLEAQLCQTLDTFFGGEIAIFSNQHFNEFASELPIIARNKLENGISKTLWYEEFVPRQTRFLVTFGLEDDVDSNQAQTFKELLKNNCYQIGANATVGYGRCLFTEVRDA